MVAKLDFDARNNTMGRQTKSAVSRGCEHFVYPDRKSIVDWIAPFHDTSASFALVRLIMSVRLPSRRLIRYIPGHFGSATMRGSSLGGLRGCLSVTLWGFCPLEMSTVAVALRNASA